LTTARKIETNRANARASTGPKTRHGRARAARNALRHSLSVPISRNPLLSEEVETLAREIAGPDASPEIRGLAYQIAEAQIDLRRVRYARHELLSRELASPYYDISFPLLRMRIRILKRILRNKKTPGAETVLDWPWREGKEKLANILVGETKQLGAMDRYERRAVAT
jgi:hypothetical protein